MIDNKISRRTFLKAGAAIGASVGAIFGIKSSEEFKLMGLTPSKAGAEGKVQTFFNACPRNCFDTCSMVTTVKDGAITFVTGNKNNTYTNGKLCVKGNTYPRLVYSPDRIKYPMRQIGRGSGNWERISWDEAFDMIAKKILAIKKEYGSTLPICLNKYSGNFDILHYGIEGMMSSIGYTTRATGTPCWPAGIDSQSFDMGTIENADPEQMIHSKYLIIWGANPAWCAVHSMSIIEKAKENGTKIVVIDPILTQTAAKADEYIQIKASTDGALALGMARYIIDHNLHDLNWMKQYSKGYEEYLDYVRTNITVEWAAEKTGVPVEVIERLAREYASTKPANIWIGYGCQRHTNGGANVRAIDALAALTGNIGILGGGVNYAQLSTWNFNYHAMSQTPPKGSQGEKNRLININNFGAEVLATKEPPIKMLWIACRNPLSQDPEPQVVQKAFEAMDFVVTADLFMTNTVKMSDLVLPVTTPFETWGINVGYWHYWINLNQQAIKPLYESKSDVEIAMGLSKRMNELEEGSCTFPTSGNLEEWVGKEFNDGTCELFGLSSWKDLYKTGTAKAKGKEIQWKDGKFKTPSGKYEFWSDVATKYNNHPLPVYLEEMQAPKEFPIRCISPHWKYSLHSQFQQLDWIEKFHDKPFIEIHPALAEEKGIKDNDNVKMFNDIGFIIVPAKITRNVPRDVVVVYEAWYKNRDFNVNFTVKAIAADMGTFQTGMTGLAFHDNFVNIEKV